MTGPPRSRTMHLVRAGYAVAPVTVYPTHSPQVGTRSVHLHMGGLLRMEGITAIPLLYDISVRNELSGETATVSVLADCQAGAQVEALVALFKIRGWRKAIASPPGAGIAAVGGAPLALDVA